jgi:hypothetical protein
MPQTKAKPPDPTVPEDYRNLALHVVCLASGQTVAIGEIFQLTGEDASDPHNVALIQDGSIVNCAAYEDAITAEGQAAVPEAEEEDDGKTSLSTSGKPGVEKPAETEEGAKE